MITDHAAALRHRLAEMPVFLERSLRDLPRAALLARPRNDPSPLAEHAWHLRYCDSHLYLRRVDELLSGQRPTLAPVDIGVWIEEHGYFRRPVAQAIAEFAAVRGDAIELLCALDADALARDGLRFTGKPVTVADIVAEMLDHDVDHRRRIAAILADFVAAGVPSDLAA